MNSLEALERLKEETQPNAYTLNHNEEDFKTIKQDLERLQQLEIADKNNANLVKTNVDLVNKNLELQKEIKELKDQLSYFKEESENWQSAYEWSQSKNSILKLEKQELKKNIEKFIEYLDKEPNRTIPKHSIKQILLKEVKQNEN